MYREFHYEWNEMGKKYGEKPNQRIKGKNKKLNEIEIG